MPPFGKTSALSHEANLKKLCIMCGLEKPPGKGANKPSQLEIASIKKHFKSDFDLASLLMPTGLCSKHRSLLQRIEKGEKTKADLPEPFDFSQLTISTQTTGNTNTGNNVYSGKTVKTLKSAKTAVSAKTVVST